MIEEVRTARIIVSLHCENRLVTSAKQMQADSLGTIRDLTVRKPGTAQIWWVACLQKGN